MNKTKRFQPALNDRLEDRTVPTGGFFGGPGDFLGGLIGSLPAKDAQAVSQAFHMFDETYAKDVQSTLYNGGAPTATTRAAFDTQIDQALTDLNTAIGTAVTNLKSTTLAPAITAVLIGSDPSTLQSELHAVATPTSGSFRSELRFFHSALNSILPATSNVVKQVSNTPDPSGAIGISAVKTDLSTIGAAFQTFSQSYNTAVKTDLNVTTPNTTQFKTDVTTALTTLNTAVTGAFSNLPASVASSLSTTVMNDILSNTTVTSNLQDKLAGLTLPTSGNRFSLFIFRWQSGGAIARAQGQVAHHLISAVSTYNSTLTV